jgi:hypothetical protein
VQGAFPALAGSKVVASSRPDCAPLRARTQCLHGALSDVELAAVSTYTKNSLGNSAGEVQPAEFKAARK